LNFNQGKGEAGVLRLYISGQTTKSVRALANLQRINDIYLKGKYRIDIYDLALDPQKVKQDQIIAVPCLVRQYPPPKTKILGDLSNTEQVLAALDEADRIYRTIVEEMMEGYVTLDKDGTILFCNKAFSDMIKNTTEQIIGSSIINMVSLADGEEIASYLSKRQLKLRKEMSLSSDSKDTIPVLSSASRIDADGNELVCMLFTDMSAQKDAETALRNKEETIARMAYFDALTGLPNRALFMDRLGNAIRNAKRSGNGLAVIFIDLDDFKRVNDTMGHWAGDLLLKEVGDRIQRSVRDSDTLSRMGGDEFAVLIPSNKDAKEADIVGSRIIQAVRNRPFEINNVPHILTASIGIAIFPNNGRSDDELLKNADIAMYKSKYQTKAQGKNQCCFFDDFMQAEIEKKILLEMNLREALNNNELAVFFQPLFEVNSGAMSPPTYLFPWQRKTSLFFNMATGY
jgi:diguanylate cyclase (GGDEF)-like protein/PAS domain S-box-containing protein